MNASNQNKPDNNWKERLYTVIFGTETPAGKAFDVALLWLILLSVLTVMLETVEAVGQEYKQLLALMEWAFTAIFTLEYILRLICVRNPRKYATSFFGLIDLMAILPTYLNFFLAGTHYLIVVRIMRLIRVFRVLKLMRFLKEGQILLAALRASRRKIVVFLAAVLTLVVIMGTIMYVVEGEENGFTSIPRGVYWAVVTLSTVGYGDVAPKTPLGQLISCLVMIMGYGIIAVPTGIVSVELHHASAKNYTVSETCSACGKVGHDPDASWCKICGNRLEKTADS